MKILMIFVDMLRPNILGIYNKRNAGNRIDSQIEKWGGTIFTNCYTPAPDTPRSLGCLWTSKYPKENGCDNRLKYPHFFLKNSCNDFLKRLKDSGYQLNFFMSETCRVLGELPQSIDGEDVNYSREKKLPDFLDSLVIKENSFTFIGIEDFHYAVSDCYAKRKYVSLGFEKVGRALELIEEKLGIDTFDLAIMFSDHGFKYLEEPVKENYYKQLNKDRTQIFMLVRKKGETKLTYNHKLACILDVYPTICNYAKISFGSDISGIDFFEKKEHESIMIEDHKTFNALMTQTIEYWGIRSRRGLACINCEQKWIANYKMDDAEKKRYINLLKTYASCFAENTKIQKIRGYYKNYLVSNPCYWDMSKRVVRKPIKVYLNETLQFFMRFLHC